ncbi:MAG: hypothetical protein DMF03_07780, partial [Verrucomicrobia bacterium]
MLGTPRPSEATTVLRHNDRHIFNAWNRFTFRQPLPALSLPFSFFLALRYLKPKRTFLSIITLISVLGVLLGVTVLILVISVMTGFDRELRQKV